jgi:molybdopterin-containing oxidoreductase family iron-sulfur binding subunit
LYDHPGKETIRNAIQKLELSLSFAYSPDESSDLVEYVAPDHHYLESWNDAEPIDGSYSLAQPCIHPIFNTRQAQESLLKWMGEDSDYRSFIENYWKNHVYKENLQSFHSFWTGCLQKGVFESGDRKNQQDIEWKGDDSIFSGADSSDQGLELTLYQTVALGNGRDANNPWLQEMPDPITKACWDNYLTISPSMAEERGLENEDLVLLSGVEVPVFVQPGQAEGTVSLALGYGREKTGKVANGVGVNAFPFVHINGQDRMYWKGGIDLQKTNKKYDLALTQTHNSMEGRPIVRETTLAEYLENPSAGNEFHIETEEHKVTLYNEVKFDGHHWGLAINQNSCTSCGACIIACQAENNIPVIGKVEVRKRRILHWIRIDRYYSEEPDSPVVFHQPVMCQHCDNAPCENVCPVSATMHSNEGINQIAYNRCIGTKYCINNCPYRVRRFNWFKYANNDEFDYTQNSDLAKLVLNPDVVVRERGVVEKCSFCVQRIQEKKLEAKLENRQLEDCEIQPACVQTCPSEALVFGDLNNPESKVSKLFKNERNYHLLEELHTLPTVGYLTKVRNVEKGKLQEEKHSEHM